jgi:hypothetical protein
MPLRVPKSVQTNRYFQCRHHLIHVITFQRYKQRMILNTNKETRGVYYIGHPFFFKKKKKKKKNGINLMYCNYLQMQIVQTKYSPPFLPFHVVL